MLFSARKCTDDKYFLAIYSQIVYNLEVIEYRSVNEFGYGSKLQKQKALQNRQIPPASDTFLDLADLDPFQNRFDWKRIQS